MRLDWEQQPDGTQMATGHETVYLLRDFGPVGSGGRDMQMECRVTGDGYPRVIVRGQVPAQFVIEAQAMEDEGVLLGTSEPTGGGWYEPAASQTSTTMK